MTRTEALQVTGGLSHPSKMPGAAYSIPATACVTGSKLAAQPGSVCHGCYALKNRYRMPTVQKALEARLATLPDARWVEAMATLLAKESWFRWHDSGDIQNVAHLRNIALVATRTPHVRHWLPTREYRMVATYRKLYGEFPANLTVRLSAHKVDGSAPAVGLPTSTVHSETPPTGAHACPAATAAHRALTKDKSPTCGECRACWDATVPVVSYPLH